MNVINQTPYLGEDKPVVNYMQQINLKKKYNTAVGLVVSLYKLK